MKSYPLETCKHRQVESGRASCLYMVKKTIFIPVLFMQLFAAHLLWAQGYEGRPCTTPSPIPKEILKLKELKDVKLGFEVNMCNPDKGQMASSFLKASGKAPLNPKDPNVKPPSEDWNEAGGAEEMYDTWTCMYSGGSAVDGNPATAWVEGVAGDGKGEAVILTQIDLTKKVEIYSGYGKSQALFLANNRPKSINVHVIRAKRKHGGASQCGDTYEEIKWINSKPAQLKDINQYQPLEIPTFKVETYQEEGDTFAYTYWLLIELVDVYPGTKFRDTCIAEVRNKI